MRPTDQLLLAVLLFIEQVNQRFAERLAADPASPSLDDVVLQERQALLASDGVWQPSSPFGRQLAALGLTPRIGPETLDAATRLILGPSRVQRHDDGTMAVTQGPEPSQWHEPIGFEDEMFLWGEPTHPSISNAPLDLPLIARQPVARLIYIDEPIDPVSLLSQYVIDAFLVREPLVHHVLQAWARSVFKLTDDESHREQLRHVCHGLNSLLYGAALPSRHNVQQLRPKAVSADVVFDRILGFIKARSAAPEREAAGLFLLLRFARVLRWRKCVCDPGTARALGHGNAALEARLRQPFEMVVATRQFDPTHLMGRTYGAQTSIPGLNYVFRGGVQAPLNRGHVTVITGPAGCGKTVLALQLVADLAARGGFGVYLSLEETTDALVERLRVFELDDHRRFVLGRCSMSDLQTFFDSHALDPDRGLLLLIECTTRADTDDETIPLEPALDLIKTVFTGHFAERAIVIDSLNVLDLPLRGPAEQDEFEDRLAIRNLLDGIRARGLRALVISEGDSARAFGKLSHLADTSMRLEWHEALGRRSLEVVKCRTQDFHAGRHQFRLSDGRGVRIYPSLASVRSTLRRRTPSTLSTKRILSLTSVLGSESPVDIKDRGMVLIAGQTGVGRSQLALRLLLEPTVIRQGEKTSSHAPGGVLVINFSTPEAKYLQRVDTFGERSRWEAVPFRRVRWYSPGENLSGSQLVDELRQVIAESRRKNHPVERVLFEDVDVTGRFIPSLGEDRLFWPTLLELTTVEPFVSIFVARSSNKSNSVAATIRDAADYSLLLEATTPGTTQISFEKLDGVWLRRGDCSVDWSYSAPFARAQARLDPA